MRNTSVKGPDAWDNGRANVVIQEIPTREDKNALIKHFSGELGTVESASTMAYAKQASLAFPDAKNIRRNLGIGAIPSNHQEAQYIFPVHWTDLMSEDKESMVTILNIVPDPDDSQYSNITVTKSVLAKIECDKKDGATVSAISSMATARPGSWRAGGFERVLVPGTEYKYLKRMPGPPNTASTCLTDMDDRVPASAQAAAFHLRVQGLSTKEISSIRDHVTSSIGVTSETTPEDLIFYHDPKNTNSSTRPVLMR